MSQTKLAEVHTIYETNARKIPDMMRESASSIEAETDEHDRTKAMIAVQVTEEGRIEIYGWGETDTLAAIGALQMSVTKLSTDSFAYFQEDE